VLFRTALVADLDELVSVQQEGAIAGLSIIFPQDRYPFPRQANLSRWTEELDDPATEVYVSTDAAGRITGFAARRSDELLHFGTAVDTWGTRLATELHDAVLGTFPASLTSARLRVFTDNRRARRFYEKLGWTRTSAVSRSTFPPYAELVGYARDLPTR
jgi:RimJ/RimL family protein N-acetyltransferase